MKICYLSILPKLGNPAGSGVLKVSETLLKEYESIPNVEVHAISLQDGLPKEFSRVSGSVTYHYLPCKSNFKTLTGYLFEKKTILVDLMLTFELKFYKIKLLKMKQY